jgi:hypothetical protein
MDEFQQVHSVAALLVARHGLRAVSVAEYEALKARHRGDEDGAQGWRSVARAAASLLYADIEDRQD